MNSCDSANQRTGQPRCAQLIANTLNSPSEVLRTYAGTFADSPSHGSENGFVNVISFVSPGGKSSTLPIAIHCRYSFRRSNGPSRYARTGVAIASATAAFSAIPTFIRNDRRDTRSVSRGCSGPSLLGDGSFLSIIAPRDPLPSPRRLHFARPC